MGILRVLSVFRSRTVISLASLLHSYNASPDWEKKQWPNFDLGSHFVSFHSATSHDAASKPFASSRISRVKRLLSEVNCRLIGDLFWMIGEGIVIDFTSEA